MPEEKKRKIEHKTLEDGRKVARCEGDDLWLIVKDEK